MTTTEKITYLENQVKLLMDILKEKNDKLIRLEAERIRNAKYIDKLENKYFHHTGNFPHPTTIITEA